MPHPETIPICAACGYDLTGLPNDAPCPECASTHRATDDSLLATGPDHLRALQRGATLALTAAATILAAAIAFPAALFLMPVSLRQTLWVSAASLTLSAILLAVAACSLPAAVLLTRPDQVSQHSLVRGLARFSTIASAATFIAIAIALIVDGSLGRGTSLAPLAAAIALSLALTAPIAFLTSGLHILAIAKRIPSPTLTRLATLFLVATPVAGAAAFTHPAAAVIAYFTLPAILLAATLTLRHAIANLRKLSPA